MRAKILLVHGTFAKNAPWTQSQSALHKELKASRHKPDIQTIEWSGRNTFEAREKAGNSIIDALHKNPINVPVAIICHSHGGSAVAYGIKQKPEAFNNVRTVVCLATPFFGFSVRPGYQALLLAILFSIFFFIFQFLYLTITAVTTEYFPKFTEQPYGMVIIGLGLLAIIGSIALGFWKRRKKLFNSFDSEIEKASDWDTTQVVLPNALFVRSMGDEVGLGLGSLQFFAMALNKTINFFSEVLLGFIDKIRTISKKFIGKVAIISILALLVFATGLLATTAASFGYNFQVVIYLLNPWEESFTIIDPQFGVADNIARVIYGLVVYTLVIAYFFLFLITCLVLISVFLSWIMTAALGCFSLRLAIASEWAVEPTPEGCHTFLNGGWNRDLNYLKERRRILQHSEPYSSNDILQKVIDHISKLLDT